MAEEEVGVGVGAAGGKGSVLSGGDPTDEAEGEVGTEEGGEDSGGGMLSGDDEVDARLAAPLSEANEGLSGRGRSRGEEVGEFIDEDNDEGGSRVGGGSDVVTIAELHRAQEIKEGMVGGDGIGDGGGGHVGSLAERSEGTVFGVNAEEADGWGRVGEDEGCCNGAEKDRLAGAGGANDEDMGDVRRRKTGDEGKTIIGEAKEGRGCRQGSGALEEGKEGQGGGARIGEGQGDAAWGAVDGEGGDTKREGEIIGEPTDSGKAGGGCWGEEELNETWTDGATSDTGRSTMGGEEGLDPIRLIVEIGPDGLLSHRAPRYMVFFG